jgi:hypothetical protein
MLASAAAWAAGIVAAAVTVPFYSGESSSRTSSATVGRTFTTTVTSSHATLVQVNGPGVLIPVAVPLIAVAFVAAALSYRRRAGKTGPGPVATSILVLLGAGTLLAMLSIGVAVLPVDALLLAACGRASLPSTEPTTRK